MTITLGAVTLNEHVSWVRKHNNGVPGSERNTLGSRTVVNRLSGANNSDIVLEARDEDNVRKGYFTKDQLDALEVYRDAGTQIALGYHGVSYNVVIRATGINVFKHLWSSQDSATEKWLGTITCKRVS